MSIGCLLAIAVLCPGQNAAPHPPALDLAVHRPGEQLAAIIGLFDTTSARSPADWLASWRRASAQSDLLPKAPQALIAAINPAMVHELGQLEGARFRLDLDQAGETSWSLRLPRDDGTFAALVSAMALTDGGLAEPLAPGAPPIDRLDRAGAVLSIRQGTAVVFASDHDALRRALAEPSNRPDLPPGVSLQLDPSQCSSARSPLLHITGRCLVGASISSVTARLAISDDTLGLETEALVPKALPFAMVEPSWLDQIPARASAAFALALDAPSIDILTGLLTGLLPDAEASPRARLSALGLLAGVAPELELWPRLRGVSGFLLLDDSASPHAAAVVLHARGANDARSLAERVVPRLVRASGLLQSALADSNPPGEAAILGAFRGRPVFLAVRNADVLLAWDPAALEAWNVSREAPIRPLRAASDLADIPIDRVSHLAIIRAWPLASVQFPAGSPACQALVDAPPLVIHGQRDGHLIRTRVLWTGLRATVERLVRATPQAPPLDTAP